MIQYTRTYTRPLTSVPWWFQVPLSVPKSDFATRMKSQYLDTGKCITEGFTFSLDELELTWTGDWISSEAFNEYDADPVLSLYWAAKDEYNTISGITKRPLTSKTV